MHLVKNVMSVGQATNRFCICTLLQTITFMLAADNCSPFKLEAYEQFSGVFWGHVLFSILKKRKNTQNKTNTRVPPKSLPTYIQCCTQKNHHLIGTPVEFDLKWGSVKANCHILCNTRTQPILFLTAEKW